MLLLLSVAAVDRRRDGRRRERGAVHLLLLLLLGPVRVHVFEAQDARRSRNEGRKEESSPSRHEQGRRSLLVAVVALARAYCVDLRLKNKWEGFAATRERKRMRVSSEHESACRAPFFSPTPTPLGCGRKPSQGAHAFLNTTPKKTQGLTPT